MRFPFLIMAVVLISSSFVVQAKMFKWVDEDGQMHFGDKIPPKYLVKEHDELNEHGVRVRHREAAKTAEEIAKEKAEARRVEHEREKSELAEKKRKQRDRVLLDTYTTERDLIVARDSRFDAVDSQIQLAETIISDSNKKIELLEKQVTKIKASNRDVPADVYQRIDSEKQQVLVQSKVMKSHKKHRDEISAQFNGYIGRFKVLKAEQKARRDKLAKARAL